MRPVREVSSRPLQIDKIVRTGRKTLALVVDSQGRLVVRAPLRLPRADIVEFVNRQADWIRSRQDRVLAMRREAVPKRFVDGECFLYLGKSYPLRIVTRAAQPLLLGQSFELDRAARPQARSVFEDWYRRQARQVIIGLVARHPNASAGLKSIRITSARTRFGSCSSLATLSFPWRLVMAPLEVVDYVVVHELVHLSVKNHSRAFWLRVESLLPDYRVRRDWLRANGHRLRLD